MFSQLMSLKHQIVKMFVTVFTQHEQQFLFKTEKQPIFAIKELETQYFIFSLNISSITQQLLQ